ncbi:ribonuclease catalytic domain-containing protein [Alcaligenes endophyticus]|uniref:RNB domain-containing ribonuclease n=1 Tax=Alcaligenes endophyticus TaxID=1929088 RepID=A0ABT8EMC3_9BURK|nr:RNB domain-containing ribonuclease [Alcaligenes endophyticus]MCX5591087.1 RNB domain-containing ribonuclease [Alcaligenes endophyticus]MDN4122335.1 RNB domain-containing ribonuclease [Alcaligenes endophyticus]
MYVLFEDSSNFKAEKVFSESDSTMQVESASGKRSKIKKNAVLFHFEQPDPVTLLEKARALAETLDIPFLWECAPQEEFEAASLAEDYFGHAPNAVEKAALIFALHDAPAHFHKRGKGLYRPAPPDILQAALAAIEKKRLQQEQVAAWTQNLIDGVLPDEIAAKAESFLSQPDKNSLEWKAFDAALKALNSHPEKLLLSLGAWSNPLALHQHRFMSQHFPKGTGFPPVELKEWGQDLPLADVEAYSVDDASTTEIDDALSVQMLDNQRLRIGIHIAAPALAITRGSSLDDIARARMSTLYTPGYKVSMLPPELIGYFSLNDDVVRPCLSLYVEADLNTGEILAHETRLERIQVRENLRQHELEHLYTSEALADPTLALPYDHWVRPLWQFAQLLSAQRDERRGKPENNNRVEYSFELDGPHDDPNSVIRLIPRVRNAPLGLLVAEYMILANQLWGGLLAQHNVPGVFRSQQYMRTRMSTTPGPHDSIGVPQYIWATSPLRRYVDLINQGQLIAAAEHGISARLAAPFQPKDADLYAIINTFENQYGAWSDYQNTLERYWCLRWLQQNQLQTVQAHVIKEDLVRLAQAPLVIRVPGLPAMERGQELSLDILRFDELALELECRWRDSSLG